MGTTFFILLLLLPMLLLLLLLLHNNSFSPGDVFFPHFPASPLALHFLILSFSCYELKEWKKIEIKEKKTRNKSNVKCSMFVSSDNKPNPPNLPKLQPMLRFRNPSDLENPKAVQYTQFYYWLCIIFQFGRLSGRSIFSDAELCKIILMAGRL